MSNSLSLSAVIAVIIVIVSGYVISYSVDMDTVADILFTGILDAVYATHGGLLSLVPTDNIDDISGSHNLEGASDIAIFNSSGHTYAAVTLSGGVVQILNVTDPSDITTAGSIDDNASLVLGKPVGIAIFESGGSTYAAIAANEDDGVQVLNVTDPSDITAAGNITNSNGAVLDALTDIATFKSGTHTYAAVISFDGIVQILNVTTPSGITAVGNITDNSDLLLNGARGVTTFKSGGDTYAAVTGNIDVGVQILNVTTPSSIIPAGNITTPALTGAQDIATFKSGIHTYAAVISNSSDDHFSILNLTNPYNIAHVDSIKDDVDLKFDAPLGVTIFKSGSKIYAAVTGNKDHGVQILDVTDLPTITTVASIDKTAGLELELEGAAGIATFVSDDRIYAAVAARQDDGVQILDVTDLPTIAAAGNIRDADIMLKGANSITIFNSSGHTYAAVASRGNHGVQILDVTNPSKIIHTDSIMNSTGVNLDGAWGITTFKSGEHTYAIVGSGHGDGVQILNVTNPYNIAAAGSIADNTTTLNLDGAGHLAIFESGGNTYAVVTAFSDDAVQILDVTNPPTITAAGNITNNPTNNPTLKLDGANDVAIFESGGDTYAAVAAYSDHAVQILNITDPHNITAADSMNNTEALLLGSQGITTFESGGDTYAAVTSNIGLYGVQMLNITNPYNIIAAGNITNNSTLELAGADGIAIFKSGTHIYAAVAANTDHGVQMLDVTNPYNITAAGNIMSNTTLELSGANDVAIFKSGGHTYAAVAAFGDDGVQIIRIDGAEDDNMPPTVNAGTDQTVVEGDTVTLNGTATYFEGDGVSYTWVAPTDPIIMLDDASSASTTFTAPNVASETTLTFTLTASDGTDSEMDSVDVIVKRMSEAFITTWRIVPADKSIIIPVHPNFSNYNYTIIWGDGSSDTGVDDNTDSHTYDVKGDYKVLIYGTYPGIYMGRSNYDDAQNLVSIDQWGPNRWASMESAFKGASEMIYNATDVPDLSGVSDMSEMFSGAYVFNGNISNWNVSSVTDMSYMFNGAEVFDGDISNWNVSSVTNMSEMFSDAAAFDQSLNGWNVSSVTDMSAMFNKASVFDQSLEDWKVSQVTDMSEMFIGTDAFNGTISNWDVSSVIDMEYMFESAVAFNGDISNWNVSSVKNMFEMFEGADSFNQNLGKWYVVANATSIARADVPGVVAEIFAQNARLDAHNPKYDIGDGIDKDFFEIVGSNQLNMTSAGAKSSYMVNVTTPDSNVFGSDNNWRMLNITVTSDIDSASTPPVITITGDPVMVEQHETYNHLAGVTCAAEETDVPFGGGLSYTGTVEVASIGDYSASYSCTSGGGMVSDSRTVQVRDSIPPMITVNTGGTEVVQGTPLSDYNDPGVTCDDGPDSPSVNDDLVLVFDSSITDTSFTITYTCTDDGGNIDTGTLSVVVVDSLNAPPVAKAGPDVRVSEGTRVMLNGTNSADPDDVDLEYLWAQVLGPTVLLSGANSAMASFDAPRVPDPVTLTFTLTVSDGVDSSSDQVTVVILDDRNDPPMLLAVPPQVADELETISFQANATDVDGNDLRFSLGDGDRPRGASITPDGAFRWTPAQSQDDVYLLNVTVSDGDGGTDSLQVQVTVNNIAPLPVSARASGQSITFTLSEPVLSDGAPPNGFSVEAGSPVSIESISGNGTGALVLSLNGTISGPATLSYNSLLGDVRDEDGRQLASFSDLDVLFPSQRRGGGTTPPAVDLGTLAHQRLVDIPLHIAKQVASHDASDPLEPLIPDGTFDLPLVINGYGYLLDDTTNTLVSQTVRAGDNSTTHITFTVYTQKDLAHFTLYLNLSDENTDYANSDTYITYTSDGTTVVTDPHGYIGSATVTVTQEDDSVPEKKTVRITVEFGEEPMGPTSMVAYMWNTDRKSTFLKIIDALEVAAAPQEPVVQAADPEPLEPDSVLPADPEPVPVDDQMPANPEPVSSGVSWPADDYDEAQVLTLVRMWSGFESEMITDTQLLELLGLEDYRGVDLPDWMMTELGVLVAKGDVTVDEFLLALQYVLENL